jgi:hypothetical protein
MGLGGWMFDGIDRFSMLGASGDPDIPGLGFRYDEDERWSVPNPTGRERVFEAFCPPHYPDMHAAVEALVERKFGKGGPHNAETPGKFPATVPSVMILNYLQAHHLDLDFYDQKLRPGSYLETHARHMETWH